MPLATVSRRYVHCRPSCRVRSGHRVCSSPAPRCLRCSPAGPIRFAWSTPCGSCSGQAAWPPARQSRTARGGGRGRALLRRAVQRAGHRAGHRARRGGRSRQPRGAAHARRATRRPSGSASAGCSTGSPPATPPPTRSRPCSTGWSSSPGRRALLGMSRRNGRLIRPLLDLTRDQTREYCRRQAWSGARTRPTSTAVSPATGCGSTCCRLLREIHPGSGPERARHRRAAERGGGAARARRGRGGRAGGGRRTCAGARRRTPARAGRPPSGGSCCGGWRRRPLAARSRCAPSRWRRSRSSPRHGGSASLDLGGGVRVISEYGRAALSAEHRGRDPEPGALPVPGRCRFGDWDLVCELEAADAGGR